MGSVLDWFLVAVVVLMAAYAIWADVRDMRAADRYAAAKRKERGESR